MFHIIACDPSNQPSLPSVLVHAGIPAFTRPEHKASCEFATHPNYTARPCLNNSKRTAFLRLTFWSFPGFPVAGLGILHLTSSLHHLAASHFPLLPWACCSVALVTFTTEGAPMWSFLRATCKKLGLITSHRSLWSQSLSLPVPLFFPVTVVTY